MRKNIPYHHQPIQSYYKQQINKQTNHHHQYHHRMKMNWGYFSAWAAAIFILFFVTGWPVTPSMKGSWGNHWNEKNLTYYGVLYFHYLIGSLFFSFLILGLFRNLIWKDEKGGNRQLTFLLAYSLLVASVFAVGLAHRYSPIEEEADENVPSSGEP
jgi:hypothetical protein